MSTPEDAKSSSQRESVVLVVGCDHQYGTAAVERFHEAAWTVYATAREADAVEALDLDTSQKRQLDLADPEAPAQTVEWVLEDAGGLDCLVVLPSVVHIGAVEDVPPRHVSAQFEEAIGGYHRLLRRALPPMRQAESGTIISVISVVGQLGIPAMGVPAAASAGLTQLNHALRHELDPHDVDVSVVQTGPSGDSAGVERHQHDDTGEYTDLYDVYQEASVFSGIGQTGPAAVAATIYQAASCADPAPRYPVDRLTAALLWARYLPADVRDAGYRILRRLA